MQVIQDFREGKWDKNSANEYILDKVGQHAVVVYTNSVEVSEEDIIVLNPKTIISAEVIK